MSQGCKIRNQHGLHFVTFTVVYWIDIFTRPIYKDLIIDSLKHCKKEKELEVFAYVIMSNHLHLIVRSQELELSNIIRDFKKFTSKKIIDTIKEIPESRKEWMLWMMERAAKKHSRNKKHQFWQQNNHPEELLSNKFIKQKIQYIHENPVRAGLVTLPEDYRYSSARNYTGLESELEIITL